MKLTEALKKFLSETFGVPADASDEQFRKVLGEKIGTGEITSEKMLELCSGKAADPLAALGDVFAKAVAPLAAANQQMAEQIKTLTAAVSSKPAATAVEAPPAPPAPVIGTDGASLMAEIDKRVEAMVAKHAQTKAETKPVNAAGVFNRAAYATFMGNPEVNVSKAIDFYNKSRSNLFYPEGHKHAELHNGSVMLGNQQMERLSQADYAVIGAWHKLQMAKASQDIQLNDHELDLMKFAINELPWSGSLNKGKAASDWIDNRKLHAHEKASLIADSTTGGGYTTPAIVETAILQIPLLFGELFPRVTLINVASGNQFLTNTIGNVTFTTGSNAVEGTGTIPLTDCTDLINQITVDIENAVGAMEVGLDLLEDSISNLGSEISGIWGRSAMKLFDDWVAAGDGTNEPLGVINTSGLNNIPSVNAGGTITLGDAENLIFGISKAYRQQRGGRMAFIGTDANYARFKGIPVAAGYNSRVLGMNYKDYMVLDHPWAVTTSSSIDNSTVAFANLGYYQMWRRLGMSFRFETGGATLARTNTGLYVARIRMGGRMMLAGACCMIDDLPE